MAASPLAASHAQPRTDTRSVSASGTRTSPMVPCTHLQYDVVNDFAPVSLLASFSSMIAARKYMPANDLKEFIAWLKANPGSASQGSAGVGSMGHIGGVYFQNVTGTRIQHVPYRGSAPAMQDLVAGQIDMMIDAPVVILPQLRAGTIKAFAVLAERRLAQAADVPTADEAGFPGFHVSNWFGLWAPKGTPKEIVGKLNAATVEDAWPTRPCARNSPTWAWRFRHASSRPRRRSAPSRRPKSKSGGRSSRRRTSRAIELRTLHKLDHGMPRNEPRLCLRVGSRRP